MQQPKGKMDGPSVTKPKGRARGPAGSRTSYQVDTKGMCVLCLRRRQRCQNKKQNEETSSQFCRVLLRYLKLNFYEDIVKQSNFKWKVNRVKKIVIELCQDCTLMAATFNKLYCQVELIQMKLNSYVRTISDIMRVAGRIPSRLQAYQERMGIKQSEQGGNPVGAALKTSSISIPKPALLAQNFRKELIQKTFQSYKRALPRVRLKRTAVVRNVPLGALKPLKSIGPASSKTAIAVLKTPLSPVQEQFRNFLLAYTLSFATILLLTTIYKGDGSVIATPSSTQGTENTDDISVIEIEESTSPQPSTSSASNNLLSNAQAKALQSPQKDGRCNNSIRITDAGKTVLLPHQSFKTDTQFVDESIMEYEDNADLIDISDDGFFAEANALAHDINASNEPGCDQPEPMELELVKQEPQESPLDVNDRTCSECRIHLSCRAELEKHRSVIHHLVNYVQCPVCKNMFASYHFLKKHRKESEACTLDEAAEALEFKTVAKSLFPYSSTIRGNRFCPMEGCFEVFLKQENLQLHLKAHGLFTCTQGACKQKFDKAHELALHESKQHSGDLSSGYKCTRCNFHVGGQYQFILHFLGEHLNIAVFSEQCDICRKGFLSKQTLANDKEVHFRTHHDVQGKDPKSIIKCDVENCEAFFLKNAQLNTHKTRIHHIEQEARLSCSICGIKILNQLVLYRHKLEAHSNLPAHEIEAQIKRRARAPARKGKYKCVYCADQFTSKYSLLIHSKVHDHLRNAQHDEEEASKMGGSSQVDTNSSKKSSKGSENPANASE